MGEVYDVLVIGGGAAGLSAGLYSARYLMKTCIVRGKEPGGETAIASLIENYPGILSIDGFDLMQVMEQQNKKLGVTLLDGEVTSLKKDGHCFTAALSEGGEELTAKSLIFAMGSKRRRMGLPKEKELTGHGVSYCATCDAPLYKGKIVAIVGGGDAAVKGANLASPYAEKVYMFVRGKAMRAEPINQDLLAQKKNVEVVYETEVKELIGEKQLEKVILSKPYNGSTEFALGGLFVEIGAEPNTALAKQLDVVLDNLGWIEVDPMMHTNVDGVFAAGDIVNETGAFKQDVVAASQGAIAATAAHHDLGIHPTVCEVHARSALI